MSPPDTPVSLADAPRTPHSGREFRDALQALNIPSFLSFNNSLSSADSLPSPPASCSNDFQQRLHNFITDFNKVHQDIRHLLTSSSYSPDLIGLIHPQVIVALATLQSSVQDLSRAYINHANTVLGPGSRGPTLDSGLTTILLDGGLLGQTNARAPTPPAGAAPDQPDKKRKRKRAPPDPNAPKRALTPYFLFMQTARAKILGELQAADGENVKPKQVADEGTKRWGAMSDAEKSVGYFLSSDALILISLRIWNTVYQENLAIYRLKTRAYKAGLPVPSDDEARAELKAKGGAEKVNADAATEEEEEDEEPAPEPTKAPSPPKSKRRKSGKAATPPPAKEPTPPPAAKKSEKSRKRGSKEEAPPPATPAAEPKSDKKKKKTSKKA